MLEGKRIGLGITASHCTYDQLLPMISSLQKEGATVVPIITHSVLHAATRFGTGEEWIKRIEEATGEKVVSSIVEAEPFGPTNPLDCMVISPLTGNSMSRFANASTDSPVLMAAKATLRNEKPVVLGVSTNDALGLNGMNLMKLLNMKNVYFIPFGQDDCIKKPNSLIADFSLLPETTASAIQGKQLQPLLILHKDA
ncbi:MULTISPECIES: dipicolinate synthase subunit B [Sporosarcina]|uniref:Dipicolinate synthase subunit B n=2 Tax=Sporosarcina newyorkensis TaxID=759851 RepID=A0A1T4YEC4_9BACL|nr:MULTISPECIES: dipicolinate synthase subunit B [Sporosarcina]EGQ27469.1 dipicolinate synthase [Sporosarcina newyorkensis 2681]MBY0222009.1 dipicolinate synthase subunit B [Sporosarcina aquimarina]SKA99888.1 dipicolinate synthase subunit B [Sporosarcina newyorkensis]